jgi:hypothetical protein
MEIVMKKIILVSLALTTFLFGAVLKVGDTLQTTQFTNQFDKDVFITKESKKLILVFSKDKGEVVKTFLEKNPNYLLSIKGHYFADVSGAPSFVTKVFMMPKFQKYPFSMIILKDEKYRDIFPNNEEFITVITLDNLKITQIEFKSNLL